MNNILYISNTFDKSSSLFFTEMVCGIEARFLKEMGKGAKTLNIVSVTTRTTVSSMCHSLSYKIYDFVLFN